MGELIRIGAPEGAPGLSAAIDTTGAWVTELSFDRDHVLFPRDLVATTKDELKFRGGMHVCSPYFGAGGITQVPHGFARNVEWRIEKQDSSELRLTHTEHPRGSMYSGLEHRIQYIVGGRIMVALLNLRNNSPWSIPIAPGFHPYFAGPDLSGRAGVHPVFEEPEETGFTRRNSHRVIELASGLVVSMNGQRMPGVVTWSDNPTEYHCVEPIASPKLGGVKVERAELEPGQSRSFVLSLEVGRAT